MQTRTRSTAARRISRWHERARRISNKNVGDTTGTQSTLQGRNVHGKRLLLGPTLYYKDLLDPQQGAPGAVTHIVVPVPELLLGGPS